MMYTDTGYPSDAAVNKYSGHAWMLESQQNNFKTVYSWEGIHDKEGYNKSIV